MAERFIMKTHANLAFAAVKARGLGPSDLEWRKVVSEKSGHTVSQLVHVPTDYYFVFDLVQDEHYCIRSPGSEGPHDKQYPGDSAAYREARDELLKAELDLRWTRQDAPEVAQSRE